MTRRISVLIVDDVHPILMDKLNDYADVDYRPDCDKSEIDELVKGCNGLVIRSKMNLNAEFLNRNNHLDFIARAGSGMDNIDLAVAEANNIVCMNAPEGNRDAVGEHTVGMLLNLACNIKKGHSEIGSGVWDREGNRGFEIGEKTVGIIGYGNTGSSVAKKLSGFGCRVLAYDKYKSGFGSDSVEEVDFDTLITESDIITFHIPLTQETEGWIAAPMFKSFNHPKVVLNLSRGGIMSTGDVINALKTGMISHLGLDVLENEKLSVLSAEEGARVKWLNLQENVIMTPHVGGWTDASYKRISEVLGDKILSWIKQTKEPEFSGGYVG